MSVCIQAKTLACDPLPDVDRETDLNTFITQWRETEDPDLESAVHMCQVAENVIRSMQDKLGEAKSMYETDQLEWCNNYIQILRKIELKKFNEVSAKVFEFMDKHTKLSQKEIDEQKNSKRNTKGDNTRMETYKSVAERREIMFGIWANVLSKNQYGIDIKFGKYVAQLPQK